METPQLSRDSAEGTEKRPQKGSKREKVFDIYAIFAEPIIFVTINKMQNRDRGSLPPVARFCVMLQSDWRSFFNRPGAFLLYFPYKNPRSSFLLCAYAVSYTHLDVYKRQALYRWPHICGRFLPLPSRMSPIRRPAPLHRFR